MIQHVKVFPLGFFFRFRYNFYHLQRGQWQVVIATTIQVEKTAESHRVMYLQTKGLTLTPDVVELFGVVDGVALLPPQRRRTLLGIHAV